MEEISRFNIWIFQEEKKSVLSKKEKRKREIEPEEGTNPWWKKRPSVMNVLGMLYILLGTIRAKNKKNWLGNLASVA